MNREEARELVTELAAASFKLGTEYGHEPPGAYQREQELRKKIVDALCSSQVVLEEDKENVSGRTN